VFELLEKFEFGTKQYRMMMRLALKDYAIIIMEVGKTRKSPSREVGQVDKAAGYDRSRAKDSVFRYFASAFFKR